MLSLDWVVSYEGTRAARCRLERQSRNHAPANNHPWKQSYKHMPTPAAAF